MPQLSSARLVGSLSWWWVGILRYMSICKLMASIQLNCPEAALGEGSHLAPNPPFSAKSCVFMCIIGIDVGSTAAAAAAAAAAIAVFDRVRSVGDEAGAFNVELSMNE